VITTNAVIQMTSLKNLTVDQVRIQISKNTVTSGGTTTTVVYNEDHTTDDASNSWFLFSLMDISP
jgi:hypothetical protein